MPNWIRNRVTVYGDAQKIKEMAETICTVGENGQYCYFDLNKIIPMPESLNIEESSDAWRGAQYLAIKVRDADEFFLSPEERQVIEIIDSMDEEWRKKCLRDGRTEINNMVDYGYPTWYKWRRHFWGTKWNTAENSYDEATNTFSFETAWNAPFPCFEALSRQYSDLEFSVIYASEDISSNCGKLRYKNGEKIFNNEPEWRSKEAFELSFHLWPEYKEYYRLEDDNYTGIDDEDEE